MLAIIAKYRFFVGRRKLWLDRKLKRWIIFFRIPFFIRVTHYVDGFFHLKFFGIRVRCTNCGISSSIELINRIGLRQQFYVFSPYIREYKFIKFRRLI